MSAKNLQKTGQRLEKPLEDADICRQPPWQKAALYLTEALWRKVKKAQ
jgi:hypothetical protein